MDWMLIQLSTVHGHVSRSECWTKSRYKYPLKWWKDSNIWEQPKRVKILFRKKLRAELSQGMFAIIRYRIFPTNLLTKNIKLKINRTIVLPVVFYGCETWSLTLREEGRLRTFEKRVLRRILGPKRDEVTGEWRKLHNEELNDLYCSILFKW